MTPTPPPVRSTIPPLVAQRIMDQVLQLKHREGRLTIQWGESCAIYRGRTQLGSGPTLAEAIADALG